MYQPPVFNETSPTRSMAENSPTGTPVGPGLPVSATDPDGDTPLTYSLLPGADADGRFQIDSTNGQISVAAGAVLDFEDTNNNPLNVTVGVSDGKTDHNQNDLDNVVDTTIDVTINVTDANDPGVVDTRRCPGVGTGAWVYWPHAYVGVPITATLHDDDGVTAGSETWGWLPIGGVTTATYTPVATDLGSQLQARVVTPTRNGVADRLRRVSPPHQ